LVGSAPVLLDYLEHHGRVALDAAVLIYTVEGHPKYFDLGHQIFSWLQSRGSAVTSTVTMTEALVRPYRLGDLNSVYKLYALLLSYPHLDWVAPNLHIADHAAQIRATHNLRTPDAIHAATALAAGVTGFITNDPVFRRVKPLEILVLDDLLS
jgi:predicted nucleic acid-binding protein